MSPPSQYSFMSFLKTYTLYCPPTFFVNWVNFRTFQIMLTFGMVSQNILSLPLLVYCTYLFLPSPLGILHIPFSPLPSGYTSHTFFSPPLGVYCTYLFLPSPRGVLQVGHGATFALHRWQVLFLMRNFHLKRKRVKLSEKLETWTIFLKKTRWQWLISWHNWATFERPEI